jgi:hypothetical protein
MKLCKHCIHFRQSEWDSGTCYIPTGRISPVDGHKIILGERALGMRAVYARCGPEGKLYVRKPPIMERIMRKLGLAALLLCLVPLVSEAAPIHLGGNGTYTSWTMSSSTFWNNTSYDRNGHANIGQWLSGTPGSDVPGFYNASPYLFPNQIGDGTYQFGFEGGLDITHLQSVTGWNDLFGVYDLNSGQMYSLGSAWDATPSTYRVYPNQWGFWLYSGEGNVWYSGGPLDNGRSHFALFNSGNTYWLGIEDATWNTRRTADWDYNDVILSWEVQPVPEPGSISMILMGLGALWTKKRFSR